MPKVIVQNSYFGKMTKEEYNRYYLSEVHTILQQYKPQPNTFLDFFSHSNDANIIPFNSLHFLDRTQDKHTLLIVQPSHIQNAASESVGSTKVISYNCS